MMENQRAGWGHGPAFIGKPCIFNGANSQNRTGDLLITNWSSGKKMCSWTYKKNYKDYTY